MPSRSRSIALGGILGALCIISVYASVYLPTNRIFFYCLSSVFCGILLTESGVKWAWVFYGATALLTVFIVPNKTGLVPYVVFFGLYGIIKYYIELIKLIVLELILKGAYFLLSMLAIAVTARGLLGAEIISKLPLWILAAGGIIIFFVYDYLYTQFIVFYMTRLRKRI